MVCSVGSFSERMRTSESEDNKVTLFALVEQR
jgi:hypothetical protein